MASLLTEFEANQAEAALVAARHQRQILSIATLMGLSAEQILELPKEKVATFISSMANPWGFDAVRGTVDALIGSGKLGVLQDRQLREALTTFIGMDQAINYDRALLLRRASATWDQIIRNGGPWRDPHGGLTSAECSTQEISVSGPCNDESFMGYLPEASSADLLRLRQDHLVMGAANQGKGVARIYLAGIEQLAGQIDIVLSLLAK